jgi:hypothetical protein
MIYRYAIYVNGVFDRYATDEEKKYLRVNENGEVERLIDWLNIAQNLFNKLPRLVFKHPNADKSLWMFWQPAPEIKVEWGTLTQDRVGNTIPIYEGQRYVDWNTGNENEHQPEQTFNLLRIWDVIPESFPMIEIIGNAHEVKND